MCRIKTHSQTCQLTPEPSPTARQQSLITVHIHGIANSCNPQHQHQQQQKKSIPNSISMHDRPSNQTEARPPYKHIPPLPPTTTKSCHIYYQPHRV